MPELERAMDRLVHAARLVANHRKSDLEGIKGGAKKWDQPDWIWEALLLSFGTMGNSRGAALVHNPEIHKTVRFDVLQQITSEHRRPVIETAMRTAKVRRPSVKTGWLVENFDRIVADGGPEAVKDQLNARPGTVAKLRFMMTFKGIGQKYARNILMDVYHPDFRESIAVDVRIKGVSDKLGLKFNGYADEEAFYLEAGHRARLQGWEMDRLLYNFTAEFIDELEKSSLNAFA
jgi:hypothetical protein